MLEQKNLRLHELQACGEYELRLAGVNPPAAMKLVDNKSERKQQRYNTVEPEKIRRGGSKLATYQAP